MLVEYSPHKWTRTWTKFMYTIWRMYFLEELLPGWIDNVSKVKINLQTFIFSILHFINSNIGTCARNNLYSFQHSQKKIYHIEIWWWRGRSECEIFARSWLTRYTLYQNRIQIFEMCFFTSETPLTYAYLTVDSDWIWKVIAESQISKRQERICGYILHLKVFW